MKKKVFGVLAIAIFGFAFVPAPVAAEPRPQYVESPAFTECTEDEYRHKRPMTRDWCVWRIQNFLNEMKWMRDASNKDASNKEVSNWPPLELDAIYGPDTAKAVKAYQRATRSDGVRGNAGPIDGIVGPKTWRTIRADCVERWGDDEHKFHSLTCFEIEQ